MAKPVITYTALRSMLIISCFTSCDRVSTSAILQVEYWPLTTEYSSSRESKIWQNTENVQHSYSYITHLYLTKILDGNRYFFAEDRVGAITVAQNVPFIAKYDSHQKTFAINLPNIRHTDDTTMAIQILKLIRSTGFAYDEHDMNQFFVKLLSHNYSRLLHAFNKGLDYIGKDSEDDTFIFGNLFLGVFPDNEITNHQYYYYCYQCPDGRHLIILQPQQDMHFIRLPKESSLSRGLAFIVSRNIWMADAVEDPNCVAEHYKLRPHACHDFHITIHIVGEKMNLSLQVKTYDLLDSANLEICLLCYHKLV